MKIRWVTIGFSTNKSWGPFAALIRWWWGTQYSHVYLRWDTPWGFQEVLEASGFSVKMKEATTWGKKQKVIQEYKFALTAREFDLVMRELRPLTGKPYGWGQVVGIALAELFKLKHNPLEDNSKSFVCSEIGYKFVKILGFRVDRTSQDRASPKDIKDILDGGR